MDFITSGFYPVLRYYTAFSRWNFISDNLIVGGACLWHAVIYFPLITCYAEVAAMRPKLRWNRNRYIGMCFGLCIRLRRSFFASKHFICRREMGSFQLRIKYKISINLLSERIPRFSRVENLNPFLAPNNASWRFSRVENLNFFFTRLGMLPAVLVG